MISRPPTEGTRIEARPCERTPTGPAFRHRIRVYWEDTDAGGVVFYANYLKFFERARTEWLRSLGFEQSVLAAGERTIFVVTRSSVRYLKPARLDDELDVTVALQRVGAASLTLSQQALDGQAVLAEAEIRIGCVETGTFRPQRIPKAILDSLE